MVSKPIQSIKKYVLKKRIGPPKKNDTLQWKINQIDFMGHLSLIIKALFNINTIENGCFLSCIVHCLHSCINQPTKSVMIKCFIN